MTTATPLHFAIPTKKVHVPHPEGKEQFFEVRGLNITDLSRLMADYAPNIAQLYNKFRDNELDMSDAHQNKAAHDIVSDVPSLYGDLIELVSSGAVTRDTALTLPVEVQLESLNVIGQATFAGEDGLGKFLTIAAGMFKSVADVADKVQIQIPSQSGTPNTA